MGLRRSSGERSSATADIARSLAASSCHVWGSALRCWCALSSSSKVAARPVLRLSGPGIREDYAGGSWRPEAKRGRTEIFNFHQTGRASNGPLEGTNNELGVLQRIAHGLTNADNFAHRALLLTPSMPT